MTVIDYCIVFCLAVFVFLGFRKGLIRQLADVLALVLGILCATRWMSNLTGLLTAFIPLPAAVLTIISYLILFLLVYWGVVLGGKVLAGVAKIILLGWLDRLGGALLGAAKGTLIISLFLFLTALLPLPKVFFASYDDARLVEPFKKVTPLVFDGIRFIIPGSGNFYHELRESVTKNASYSFETLMHDARIRRLFSTFSRE